jgi:hypothetical protein
MNCEIQLGNGGFILPFRQPLTFNMSHNMSHLRKQVRQGRGRKALAFNIHN